MLQSFTLLLVNTFTHSREYWQLSTNPTRNLPKKAGTDARGRGVASFVSRGEVDPEKRLAILTKLSEQQASQHSLDSKFKLQSDFYTSAEMAAKDPPLSSHRDRL